VGAAAQNRAIQSAWLGMARAVSAMDSRIAFSRWARAASGTLSLTGS
jgi:hypothetical protein